LTKLRFPAKMHSQAKKLTKKELCSLKSKVGGLKSAQGEKMKILVIDDKPENIESARREFGGHDLTAISDVDEAVKHLRIKYDEIKKEELKKGGMKWREALEKSRLPFPYDVVLVDLMLPASGYMLGDKKVFAGQEMPYGFGLAILAAKNGAKKVAVVTSMDHHQHPMSAFIDHIDGHIHIAEAEVVFLQLPDYNRPPKPKSWKRAVEILFGQERREKTAEEIIRGE